MHRFVIMKQVLNNPAFYALATGNKQLNEGDEHIKFFSNQVAPFAGFDIDTQQGFQKLYELLPHDGPAIYISPDPIEIPEQWDIVNLIMCYQMIYEGDHTSADKPLRSLTYNDVPQMLALTQLTNPGPFLNNTINFGHYEGIFEGNKLIAMAGQRLNPLPYAEISAVCTHPDHLGKGYAKQLLLSQADRIKTEGNIPFLHVREDNTRAIEVYKSMGFTIHQQLHFYVLKKRSL